MWLDLHGDKAVPAADEAKGEAVMDRLGVIVYWLGSGIAALCLALIAVVTVFGGNLPDQAVILASSTIIGASAWLLGRRFRYSRRRAKRAEER